MADRKCQDVMMIILTFVYELRLILPTTENVVGRKVLHLGPSEADLVLMIQGQGLSVGGDLRGAWESETGREGQPLLYYYCIIIV